MSETPEAPATKPFTDYLATVMVTDGQAVALLSNLADGQSDRDPTLVEAINKAITDITAPKDEAPTEASGPTPTY